MLPPLGANVRRYRRSSAGDNKMTRRGTWRHQRCASSTERSFWPFIWFLSPARFPKLSFSWSWGHVIWKWLLSLCRWFTDSGWEDGIICPIIYPEKAIKLIPKMRKASVRCLLIKIAANFDYIVQISLYNSEYFLWFDWQTICQISVMLSWKAIWSKKWGEAGRRDERRQKHNTRTSNRTRHHDQSWAVPEVLPVPPATSRREYRAIASI